MMIMLVLPQWSTGKGDNYDDKNYNNDKDATHEDDDDDMHSYISY